MTAFSIKHTLPIPFTSSSQFTQVLYDRTQAEGFSIFLQSVLSSPAVLGNLCGPNHLLHFAGKSDLRGILAFPRAEGDEQPDVSPHWQDFWCPLAPWVSYLKCSFFGSTFEFSTFWAWGLWAFRPSLSVPKPLL